MKFKVGDKVRVVGTSYSFKQNCVGKIATIKEINPNAWFRKEEHYGVGLTYIFFASELELVCDNKIVITTDGNETIARLYEGDKVIKSATAKCSPDDTFNFETGARMAFDRLFAEEKKEEKPKFEVGKMYKYNGLAMNDNGVIKITGYKDGYYSFEVIKGMKFCPTEKKFGDTSGMALYCLKEATPEDLKIEVGETVKVVNNGRNYRIYDKWFTKNAPELAARYVYNNDGIPDGTRGVVRKIAPPSTSKECFMLLSLKRVFTLLAKAA